MTMNYYVSGENVNGRPCRGVVHVVKKGDTLYKISRVYDVKVADLIWMNPGVRIYNLQVGDKICVPVSSWEMPESSKPLMVMCLIIKCKKRFFLLTEFCKEILKLFKSIHDF